MESSPPETIAFSLRGRPSAITLEERGLHHPGSSRRRSLVYTAYEDVTHLATSGRALWIGTLHSVYLVSRSAFVDANGPENVVRALLEQIARQPGGSLQLARMAEIEETARTPGSLHATWGLLLVCAAVYAAQWWIGQSVHTVGYFGGVLVADGDWWRIVTGNLLHAFPAHLIFNLLGLLAVGALVERSLGTARTLCVMAVSGAGAMAASALFTPLPVVGVSGVVSGLFGAVLWLELRQARALPAWWRVPRRVLWWVLAASALLSLLPFVAGAAHAGGFLAGAAAVALLLRGRLGRRPSATWVRAVAAGALAAVAASVGVATWELLRDGEFNARHVARLGRLPQVSDEELNDIAWMIAIDESSSDELLGAALELAERAVEESGRAKPHILDTLAEVHFQLGHQEEALAAIDEAIAQEPEDDYYQEQRRRFLGERDADDRPRFVPPQPRVPPEDPGIRV